MNRPTKPHEIAALALIFAGAMLGVFGLWLLHPGLAFVCGGVMVAMAGIVVAAGHD